MIKFSAGTYKPKLSEKLNWKLSAISEDDLNRAEQLRIKQESEKSA